MTKVKLVLLFAAFRLQDLPHTTRWPQGKIKRRPARKRPVGTAESSGLTRTNHGWTSARGTKRVRFDSSTKWTAGTETRYTGDYQEGEDVICLGTYDEKGALHATRIDLRKTHHKTL